MNSAFFEIEFRRKSQLIRIARAATLEFGRPISGSPSGDGRAELLADTRAKNWIRRSVDLIAMQVDE